MNVNPVVSLTPRAFAIISVSLYSHLYEENLHEGWLFFDEKFRSKDSDKNILLDRWDFLFFG